MSVGTESLWNHTVVLRRVDSLNQLVENEHLDLPVMRSLVVNTAKPQSVIEHVVRQGDTWSNIAARYYKGRSDFGRVIMEWSGVEDPFEELTVGRKLVIPTLDVVMFDVLRFDESRKGRVSDDSVE